MVELKKKQEQEVQKKNPRVLEPEPCGSSEI